MEFEGIHHHFQPIFSCKSNKIFGYEALIRTHNNASPQMLFISAKKEGYHAKLDIFSLNKVFKEISEIDIQERIFVNVFPTTIISDDFFIFIKNMIHIHRELVKLIVFEINITYEDQELWNRPDFKDAVRHLKNLGFEIAIGNAGADISSIINMIVLKPHYIKLDYFHMKSIFRSPKERGKLELLQEYKDKTQITLVGIENEEEVKFVKKNFHLVQGYYYARPNKLSKWILKNDAKEFVSRKV